VIWNEVDEETAQHQLKNVSVNINYIQPECQAFVPVEYICGI